MGRKDSEEPIVYGCCTFEAVVPAIGTMVVGIERDLELTVGFGDDT